MSQRALGRAARVPQSTIARIEAGTIYPRSDTLERLLGAAGRTLISEPKAGYGVDRTQIRALLALSPTERVQLLTGDARSLQALDHARVRRA